MSKYDLSFEKMKRHELTLNDVKLLGASWSLVDNFFLHVACETACNMTKTDSAPLFTLHNKIRDAKYLIESGFYRYEGFLKVKEDPTFYDFLEYFEGIGEDKFKYWEIILGEFLHADVTITPKRKC